MKELRKIHVLLFFGALICALNIGFFTLSPRKESTLVAQNTYMGPTEPVPGNPQLVKVELLIKDSSDISGVQIQSVIFDGQAIPLKPRDIFGKRGAASFQLPPGKYTLRWTVNRNKTIWPRNLSHEEEVSLSPRDLWVQILIIGDEASIR